MVQRSIIYSLGTKFLSHAMILIQGMLVARMLGPEGKGLQAKILVSYSFFVILFDLGLSNSLNYFFGNHTLSLRNLRKVILFILTSQFFLALLVLIILQFDVIGYFFVPVQDKVYFYYIYIGSLIFFENMFLVLYSYLSAHLNFKMINYIDLLSAFFKMCGIISLYFVFEKQAPLKFILASDFSVNILCLIILSLFCFSKMAKDLGHLNAGVPTTEDVNFNFKNFRTQLFSYAFPLLVSNIIFYLNSKLDYWVIQKHLGFESLGYYSVANSGAQLMTIVPITIGAIVLSYLNRLPQNEKIRFFSYYSKLNFTGLLCLSICGLFLAKLFINLMFGSRFDESIILFQMFLFVCLFSSHKYMLGIFLQSMGEIKLKLKADFISLIVNVTGLIFIIKQFGMYGAVLFQLFLQIVSVSLIHFFLSRKSIQLKNIYLLDTFQAPLGSSITPQILPK